LVYARQPAFIPPCGVTPGFPLLLFASAVSSMLCFVVRAYFVLQCSTLAGCAAPDVCCDSTVKCSAQSAGTTAAAHFWVACLQAASVEWMLAAACRLSMPALCNSLLHGHVRHICMCWRLIGTSSLFLTQIGSIGAFFCPWLAFIVGHAGLRCSTFHVTNSTAKVIPCWSALIGARCVLRACRCRIATASFGSRAVP
jgi:hypothetical protein